MIYFILNGTDNKGWNRYGYLRKRRKKFKVGIFKVDVLFSGGVSRFGNGTDFFLMFIFNSDFKDRC